VAISWQELGKKVLIAIALLSIVAAAIYGNLPQTEDDVEKYLTEVTPEAASFSLLSSDTDEYRYIFAANEGNGNTLGYVTISQGQGFSGKVTTVVGWSLDGTITYLDVPEHHDDIIWWRTLLQEEYFDQYIGRQYNEPLQLNSDIDAVTGATYSCRGVSAAIQSGRILVSEQLGHPYPEIKEPIKFGNEEIFVLIGLGLVLSIRTIPILRTYKWIRYVMLGFGFAALGIWLLIPLSLTNFVVWLAGSAPVIETQLYMYILVLGLITIAVFMGKNYWCFWLCPYAAVQETMHAMGKVSLKPSQKVDRIFRQARYVLLWLAVFLALLLSNASITVFEPWSTLFNLKGNAVGWIIVALTLGFSLVIRNIWCVYLCPVGATMDLFIRTRRRIRLIWKETIESRIVKRG